MSWTALPLSFLLVGLATAQAAPAGVWRGSFQPPPIQMPFVLQISGSGSTISAKTQSPNQKLDFDPVDSISATKTHLSYAQSQFNLVFTGAISGNTISGSFTQGGTTDKVFLVHVLPDDPCGRSAESVTGEWRGTFEYSPPALPYVLTVTGSGTSLGATTQTPSLGPSVYPIDSISVRGSTLSFKQGQLGVSFTGDFNDNTLVGKITENGYTIPITLQHF